MRHLGSISDLTADEVIGILDRAEELRTGALPRSHVGRVLTLAFFQASTRTRIGFASAGIRSGFGAVDLWAERYEASMSSPESLSDTIRVVSAYSDVLVLRHPSSDSWATAITAVRCPVINGGCGDGEHPTQSLVDMFAIRRATGRLDSLNVGIVGDVQSSRSAHSLMRGLAKFGANEFRLMGPAKRVDAGVAALWAGDGAKRVTVLHDLDLRGLDVLYVAGLPEGSGPSRLNVAERARFSITPSRLRVFPDSGVLLCPLPIVDEIDRRNDVDQRARYFDQSDDGMWTRMAVLEHAAQRAVRNEETSAPKSTVARTSQ
jgi:aspartate carbamoyltransferase catalytic subunit